MSLKISSLRLTSEGLAVPRRDDKKSISCLLVLLKTALWLLNHIRTGGEVRIVGRLVCGSAGVLHGKRKQAALLKVLLFYCAAVSCYLLILPNGAPEGSDTDVINVILIFARREGLG
jgi:hypothetical protein